eukprot:4435640-Amphidinium_carterae.1
MGPMLQTSDLEHGSSTLTSSFRDEHFRTTRVCELMSWFEEASQLKKSVQAVHLPKHTLATRADSMGCKQLRDVT